MYVFLAVINFLRMAFVLIAARNPSAGVLIDSRVYLGLANWIATKGNYQHPSGQDLFWPPGYPVFLRLLGSVDSLTVLRVYTAQLGLCVLIACLLVVFGKIIQNQRVGIYAAIVYSLSPNTQFWSLTVMSEILFAFWITLSLILFIKYLSLRKPEMVFYSGLFLGIGALTRPIGLYLIPLWAIVLIWVHSRVIRPVQWVPIISFLLGSGLVIVPWMTRNYLIRGNFVFSKVSVKTSTNFNLANVISTAEGISREEATGLVDSNANGFSEMLRVSRLYPKEFIRVQSQGILRVAFGIESGVWSRILIREDQRGQSFGILSLLSKAQFREAILRIRSLISEPTSRLLLLLGLWGIGYTVILYLLSVVGVTSNKTMPVSVIWVLIITVVYLTVIPGAAGQARFRIPIEPFLALMAGIGLDRIYSRRIGSVERRPLKTSTSE